MPPGPQHVSRHGNESLPSMLLLVSYLRQKCVDVTNARREEEHWRVRRGSDGGAWPFQSLQRHSMPLGSSKGTNACFALVEKRARTNGPFLVARRAKSGRPFGLFPSPAVQTAQQRAGVSFYRSEIIENHKYGLSKQRK